MPCHRGTNGRGLRCDPDKVPIRLLHENISRVDYLLYELFTRFSIMGFYASFDTPGDGATTQDLELSPSARQATSSCSYSEEVGVLRRFRRRPVCRDGAGASGVGSTGPLRIIQAQLVSNSKLEYM
jgi:hypothetical protein